MARALALVWAAAGPGATAPATIPASSRTAAATAVAGEQTAPVGGLAERLGIERFRRTFRSAEEGAPSSITQVAQTPDGWIWLTSSDGLQRFDGLTFEQVPMPAGTPFELANPTGLMVTRRGELWVGFGHSAGVAVYRNGRIVDMHMPDPDSVTTGLVEAADGSIWALGNKSMQRYRNGRWQRINEALGVPAGTLLRLVKGADGTLWLATNRGDTPALSFLSPGSARFVPSTVRLEGSPGIAIDPGGRLWVSDKLGLRVVAGPDGRPPARPVSLPAVIGGSRMKMGFDAAGGLWGAAGSAGLVHVPRAAYGNPQPGDMQRLAAEQGGTFNPVYDVLADKEGNVFVTSQLGLFLFREKAVLTEPQIAPGQASSGLGMARTKTGTIVVASPTGVFSIDGDGPPRRIGAAHLDGLCAARDGGVWGVSAAALLRYRGGQWSTVLPLTGVDQSAECAEDASGRLWIPRNDGSLSWYDGHGLRDVPQGWPKTPWWQLVVTARGDLAYKSTEAAVRIAGGIPWVAALPVRDREETAMIAPGLRDLFIGSPAGLIRLREGRLARIDKDHVPWVVGLRWMIQTRRGETWMLRRNGVSRMLTADLDRAFADPRARLPRRIYDRLDGMAPTQNLGVVGAQMAEDRQGRIWFLTQGGASVIDPATLPPQGPPPRVVIASLMAARGKVFAPANMVLPSGTRSLEIAYAGFSFAFPERVRFRYRLEGVDGDWVEAGARRRANYGNLGPGTYRFSVIAANGDGAWSPRPATLDLRIEAGLLEGWPFRILCVAGVIGMLWLAYALRMRAVAARLRARMAERTAERTRIARELHDTLLQSVQALTLRFQVAIDHLREDEPARAPLGAAIDLADKVIAEGRDRVHDLRTLDDGDIANVASDLLARQSFDVGVETAVTSSGAPRSIDPLAFDEIVSILGEAIFNVRRHAEACAVLVAIQYDKRLVIRVVDNGRGIDPRVLAAGARDGHFGLPGMAERARRLRGQLLIRPGKDGAGTEMVLTIPGRIAYKAGRSGFAGRFRSS
ncbi:triple tyrosine motif-containing protein [Sphingobium sp. H39-3-25]|nr:triple tyrosine motif-containing protein [Sphingobium arseniciresistens]